MLNPINGLSISSSASSPMSSLDRDLENCRDEKKKLQIMKNAIMSLDNVPLGEREKSLETLLCMAKVHFSEKRIVVLEQILRIALYDNLLKEPFWAEFLDVIQMTPLRDQLDLLHELVQVARKYNRDIEFLNRELEIVLRKMFDHHGLTHATTEDKYTALDKLGFIAGRCVKTPDFWIVFVNMAATFVDQPIDAGTIKSAEECATQTPYDYLVDCVIFRLHDAGITDIAPWSALLTIGLRLQKSAQKELIDCMANSLNSLKVVDKVLWTDLLSSILTLVNIGKVTDYPYLASLDPHLAYSGIYKTHGILTKQCPAPEVIGEALIIWMKSGQLIIPQTIEPILL
jgi:hypothetical protein